MVTCSMQGALGASDMPSIMALCSAPLRRQQDAEVAEDALLELLAALAPACDHHQDHQDHQDLQ